MYHDIKFARFLLTLHLSVSLVNSKHRTQFSYVISEKWNCRTSWIEPRSWQNITRVRKNQTDINIWCRGRIYCWARPQKFMGPHFLYILHDTYL